MSMGKWMAGAAFLLAASLASAHGHVPVIDDSHPEAAKIKLCSRMSDVALQAMYDRDKGRPIKLYEEDGTSAPRLANEVIRQVYDEPQISSSRAAMAIGRGRCNEYFEKKQ